MRFAPAIAGAVWGVVTSRMGYGIDDPVFWVGMFYGMAMYLIGVVQALGD